MRREPTYCQARNHSGATCPQAGSYLIVGIPLCGRHHTRARQDLLGITPSSVVYYAGDLQTRHIKIGTSANLPERLPALARKRKIALLATEPGDIRLERRRHQEFKAFRLHGEWFARDGSLMVHINDLRAKHGILHAGGPIPAVYLR